MPQVAQKVVLRRHGVELIKRQRLLARDDLQVGQVDGCHDGAAHPAHGTIAASQLLQAVWQRQAQPARPRNGSLPREPV